jgi:hypothetical protein
MGASPNTPSLNINFKIAGGMVRTSYRFKRRHGRKLSVEPEDKPLPSMHLLDQVEYGDMSPMRIPLGLWRIS